MFLFRQILYSIYYPSQQMIANNSCDQNEDEGEEDYDADDKEKKEILMMQVMMQV